MKMARKRTEPIKETQMISLADIAFLIIFFFMLSSTFMRDQSVVVLPTLSKTGETKSAIAVAIDKDGNITLDGKSIGSAGTLETELKGLLAGKTHHKDCEVRLRCDKRLTYKHYKDVYQAISNAGGVIAIMHEVKR